MTTHRAPRTAQQRFKEGNPDLAPPPRPEQRRSRFVAYEVAPRLLNRRDVARLAEELYPRRLRNAGIASRALLRVHVTEQGTVDDVEMREASGHPDLDEAALELGRSMRFSPAMNRHRPTAVWVAIPVAFDVREDTNAEVGGVLPV